MSKLDTARDQMVIARLALFDADLALVDQHTDDALAQVQRAIAAAGEAKRLLEEAP